MKILPSLALAAVASFIGSEQVGAVIILNTNFDSATPGNYQTVTSPGIPGTDGMFSRGDANRYVTITDLDGAGPGTNNALQFTHNSATSGDPYAYKLFTGASTGPTGNNFITGSFNLTITNATNNILSVMLNSNLSGSATASASSFSIRASTGVITYYNSPNDTATSPFTLSSGVDYLFTVDVDLSSTTQDIWRLRVVNTTNPLLQWDSGWINTRAANMTPNQLVWYGGVTSTLSTGFMQIDNLNYELTTVPVPEPSAPLLLALGLCVFNAARRAGKRHLV